MATTIVGALSVEITADVQGVKDGLKATGEALKLSGKKLRESSNKWGKWAVAAAAATTVVTAAIVKSNLTSIRELKNVAEAANTTVKAFQRGAFAAEEFGISQEKYGDILKDTSDRIGDFLITGGGPMVDFFEKIAPKVGITAEAFKGLSGQESLGLYVSSLEKAGVSQNEMAFFMEALASDSTRLTPLFKDNGKAFNALTKEAKSLGIGLSNVDVAKAELATESLQKTSGIIDSMAKQLTVELAPLVAAVADGFVDMAKESGGASQFIKDGIDGVITVVGIFADGLHGIKVIFKVLEAAAIGYSALVVSVFEGVVNTIAGAIDGLVGIANRAISSINEIFDTGISEIPEVGSTAFVRSINEVGEGMREMVSDTNAELHELAMEGLPSEQIKQFADEAIVEYERVAAARAALTAKAEDAREEDEGIGTSQVEIYEAETIGLLEAMSLRFASQEEMELVHLAREREALTAHLAANKELTAEQSAALVEIKQAEEDAKRAITLNAVQAGFQALAKNSKKVQGLMKTVAIAQALIKGKQAAVDAWQAGMSTGTPWAPIVAAAYTAASIANTGSMIAGIRSSGSSSSSPSASLPSVPTGGTVPGGSTGQPAAAQQPQAISVNILGEGLLSTDQVRGLMGQINDQLGDGLQLNVN